jgi:D-ribose pyranose/furanose isomerase RbsD
MGTILSTYVATKILVSEPSFQQLMDVISKEIKGTSAVLMKEIELQHLRVQETNTLIFNTVVIVIGGLVICKGMNHLYDYYTLRKTKYV